MFVKERGLQGGEVVGNGDTRLVDSLVDSCGWRHGRNASGIFGHTADYGPGHACLGGQDLQQDVAARGGGGEGKQVWKDEGVVRMKGEHYNNQKHSPRTI